MNMDIKPVNVLLVDDDPALRRLVGRILSKPDSDFACNLETEATLSGAVSTLKQKHFDNVLLDLGLPDSRGAESVRAIHRMTPGIPIVVLTACSDKGVELAARQCGAEDYLVKGSDMSRTLVPHIRYAIKRKQARDALEQSYRNFKLIVHNAPDAIICISPEGRILEFNAKAEELFNCMKKDVLGDRFLDLCIGHEDRFRIYADLRKVQAGEEISDIRSSFTCAGRQEKVFRWSFSSMCCSPDSSVVIIATAHEISAGVEGASGPTGGPRLVFNPDFDNTVDLVLNSLSAIIDRIDKVNKEVTPETLGKLQRSYNGQFPGERELPPEKARAIERLIVNLMTSDEKQIS